MYSTAIAVLYNIIMYCNIAIIWPYCNNIATVPVLDYLPDGILEYTVYSTCTPSRYML